MRPQKGKTIFASGVHRGGRHVSGIEGLANLQGFPCSGLPNYERADLVTAEGSVSRMNGPAWRPRTELEFTPGEESILRVTGRDGQ
ncbi:MAG TPA: hypothetical protein DCY33_01935, partial [Gemmatimonadetes bacterium]|nr:hypothetical protein [Gemmatimonadota bacterium]